MTPSLSAGPTSIATDRTRTCASNCWPCIPRNSRRSWTCCGRTPMSRISKALFVLALALFVAPLRADNNDDDNRYEVKVSKDLHLGSGGRVTIDHRFGDLNVRTQSGSTVSVRATVRSSDPEVGQAIRIAASEEGSNVNIRTIYPEVHIRNGHLSYSVDMTVTIPPSAQLTAKNQFGATDVRGLRSSATIDNKQGSIVFSDARGGGYQVSNAFGGIDIVDVAGDLTVSNSNGGITINNAGGHLTVTNRFGAVSVDNAKHDVTITNSKGAVTALDIDGQLRVTNAFGNVKASTLGGSADITVANARVDLANVNGSATVRNSFGSVVAQTIRGDLTVDSQNSKVDAVNISGNAKIETAFGGVTLQNVGGIADITTSNANIKVTDVGGAFTAETRFGSLRAERVRGPADVKGSNGGITLQDTNGDGKVRTSFGAAVLRARA